MKNFSLKTLKANIAAIAFATAMVTMIIGCAAPKQGPMFYSTSKALRAAQTAGALEFAPGEYQLAHENYRKAEVMNQKRRTDRAQKLLELATAQANLAETISEAEQAEASIGYLRTSLNR